MGKNHRKILFRAVTIVMVAAVLLCALWIMKNRLGLSDEHDFGAGAYYYADIPDFDKVLKDKGIATSIPMWIYIVLFLAWGWLMWRLWCWIDSRKKEQ